MYMHTRTRVMYVRVPLLIILLGFCYCRGELAFTSVHCYCNALPAAALSVCAQPQLHIAYVCNNNIYVMTVNSLVHT